MPERPSPEERRAGLRNQPGNGLRPDWTEPHPSRFAADAPARDAVLELHRRACDAGLSTYLDPATGYSVMTAVYLRDRGYCCNAGCRHCPYVGHRLSEDS
ncbi:MAG: DUF5522 domain-containing protein [Ilumatobacteraceae bacterium]